MRVGSTKQVGHTLVMIEKHVIRVLVFIRSHHFVGSLPQSYFLSQNSHYLFDCFPPWPSNLSLKPFTQTALLLSPSIVQRCHEFRFLPFFPLLIIYIFSYMFMLLKLRYDNYVSRFVSGLVTWTHVYTQYSKFALFYNVLGKCLC